jgi:hypothetical protein
MADLTITAANVLPGAKAALEDMKAGAAITAGQVVYKEAGTGLAKLADCDSATTEARIAYGIALHAASTGQPLKVLRSGPVTIGATLTAGTDYWLSGNAGGICPRADTAAGDRIVLIGVATSAAVLNVLNFDSGVTI